MGGWARTPQDSTVVDDYDSDEGGFDFEKSCEFGRNWAHKHFLRNQYCAIVKIPKSKDQEIRTPQGMPLSYNYKLGSSVKVELVVANSASTDARDLLQSFDILACASYYDG